LRTPDKAVWGWVAYDWANSAFATTVMAGFFPIFFKKYWCIGDEVTTSTAMLGFSNSIAGIIVALTGPVLGAVADKASLRKTMLLVFAYLGVFSTTALFFVDKGQWLSATFFYISGVIGFSCSVVFYDALLPSVAAPERIHHVSGMGFAAGYLGGGLLFLVNVLMTIMPDVFGFENSTYAVRISFLTVALWWGGFTLLTIAWVPNEREKIIYSINKPLLAGVIQLYSTIKDIKSYRSVFIFLIAYWCYIDGVDTIIRMAVDYGLSIGFQTEDLIIALLIVQFVGFPAAVFFGRLGQLWGPRKPIFIALGVYMAVTCWGVMMTRRWEFYLLAIAVGCVQGGVQSLSRSYYAQLIPEGQEAEFFGFYNMVGKSAVIIGPTLMGIVGLFFEKLVISSMPAIEGVQWGSHISSRAGMASLLVLFIAGMAFLKKAGRSDGQKKSGFISS